MAAEFTGEEIIDLTNGRLAQGMMPDETGVLASDSRSLPEGAWFVALVGHDYDGHDFIGDAFSAGALGCIVEERGSYPIASTGFPLIAVDNTYDAFQQLARNWRKRLNPRVICVTAAPGRPSDVMDLCCNLLSSTRRVVRHEEGDVEALLNGIVALDETTRVFVAKVALASLSQSELIGRALVPSVVILTEEGFSHLRAASEEAIARAECDLLAHMDKANAVAVVSKRSQDLLTRIRYHFPERALLFDESTARSETDSDGRHVYKFADTAVVFRAVHEYLPSDLWSAIAACKQIGMSYEEIATRLSELT